MVEAGAEEWVSLREFSRRRSVTLAAVQKAIETGRVTAVRRNERGRLKAIEVNQATVQWDSHTDPVQAARSGQVLGEPAAAPIGQLALGVEPTVATSAQPESSGGQQDSYYVARAKREEFAAKEAELKYLQTIGMLVSAEEVRTISARRYRALRDAFMAVAEQEAPVLEGLKGAEIRERLTRAFTKVLHELSDAARADAARGDSERLAA